MFIYNDLYVQIAYKRDKDSNYEILNTYNIGDIITVKGITGRITAINNLNFRLEEKDKKNNTIIHTFAFYELEPLLLNEQNTDLQENYYCVLSLNQYKLIQGHDIFNPGDKCIATFISKNIIKEPCIYVDTETKDDKIHVNFEIIHSKERIILEYGKFDSYKSGQFKEDKNVYLSKEE